MKNNHSVLLANLTWNESGWRNIYLNSKAHHTYAQEHPGHESLNFDFNKKHVDTKKHVFGYIQWNDRPVFFETGGTIIFFSLDYVNDNKSKIIGIYSKAQILSQRIQSKWKGFEKNNLWSNINAEKDYSLLFPIPLHLNKYCKGVRFYTYKNTNLLKQILIDEISLLSKAGMMIEEYIKLNNIYEYVTGEAFSIRHKIDPDEKEQDKLTRIYCTNLTKEEIIEELTKHIPKEPEIIVIKGKAFKRDNKVIALLKILRDYKCQICGNSIKKKNGKFYVEAAHIKEKRFKGQETAENILILCPNHHKEFDYGKKNSILQTKEFIKLNLNNKNYKIDLRLK